MCAIEIVCFGLSNLGDLAMQLFHTDATVPYRRSCSLHRWSVTRECFVFGKYGGLGESCGEAKEKVGGSFT